MHAPTRTQESRRWEHPAKAHGMGHLLLRRGVPSGPAGWADPGCSFNRSAGERCTSLLVLLRTPAPQVQSSGGFLTDLQLPRHQVLDIVGERPATISRGGCRSQHHSGTPCRLSRRPYVPAGQPGVTYPHGKGTLSNPSNPVCCKATSIPSLPAPDRVSLLSQLSQTKPSAAAALAPGGQSPAAGPRPAADRSPAWTCPKTESQPHLWVVPCADGLWSRQRWLCSPESCSEPEGCWPARPTHTHWHWHRYLHRHVKPPLLTSPRSDPGT